MPVLVLMTRHLISREEIAIQIIPLARRVLSADSMDQICSNSTLLVAFLLEVLLNLVPSILPRMRNERATLLVVSTSGKIQTLVPSSCCCYSKVLVLAE